MNNTDFIIERSILKIGNKLNNIRNDDLKKHQLTASQSETLLYFYKHPGMTVADLKLYLQVSHQAARNIVERLKERNLVFSTPSREDGRANAVFLSEEGKHLAQCLTQTGTGIATRLLDSLDDSEKSELLRMLSVISDNMDK